MADTLLHPSRQVFIDLTTDELITKALENGEGVKAANGAFCALTGERTGRSPKDRFIVKEMGSEAYIDWGCNNQSISEETFDKIWQKACQYIETKDHYVSHLSVGADPKHQITVKAVTELAWHNLFVRQLFIRPEHSEVLNHTHGWTILSAPRLELNPEKDITNSKAFIGLDFAKQRVLICGTAYAGEMKKAMFTVLNYLLPQKGILPMHCSANVGEEGDVALFFGLSGTGKTTLSADPKRKLIGDDEHGWSEDGIFNFEGGCYAKCIDLSQEKEPMIWDAIRYGAVVENVVLDSNGFPKYEDATITENTRAAYPREFISPRVIENRAGHPRHVIFLTCDLFGVLPPVAKLNRYQAAYHFLSGYTALVGSTEVGSSSGIKPTFSTCFGAPFFPRPPKVYADLLLQWLDKTGATVYLVNTGWTGGRYGVGRRFDIPTTRAVIDAILNDEVALAETRILPGFQLEVPKALTHVQQQLLNPEQTWTDKQAYQTALEELKQLFAQNFRRFEVSEEIRAAGPV